MGFATNGVLKYDIANDDESCSHLVATSDGKIVAAGYTQNDRTDLLLMKFDSNGVLDTSFGNAGSIVHQVTSSGSYVANFTEVQEVADGKIVAIYNLFVPHYHYVLTRFNSDGGRIWRPRGKPRPRTSSVVL